ncbi:MAG: histidine kinase N-terminal 7TM domain-containing protein [Ardenticatenia bacterium]|nr:histidine kinase N-terminal 7TM domain-containing protein [Ardenticatenia bacterium]
MSDGITIFNVLNLLNLVLASINLLLTFSLFVYIVTHNLRHSLARAFALLLAFVAIVFGVDVVLSRVTEPQAATLWLKLQWVGIALVPAAYLHFSDALLRTTGAASRNRRLAVMGAYAVGVTFFVLVVTTHLIVDQAVVYAPWATQFTAGPYFWVFVLYFFVISAWGFANTLWARQRTLTSTSRRRMTYLVVTFAAPGMAVYPYLLLASLPARLPPLVLMGILLVGNVGVAAMLVVMTYSVAYHGALAPDRVVKHSLLTYLVRGPLLGMFVIVLTLVVPRVEMLLGLPRETVLIFAIVGGIVFFQALVQFLQPAFDYLIYQKDRDELRFWRQFSDRLLTSSDLRQLMENILTALCDLLRAEHGCVLVLQNSRLTVETFSGDRDVAEAFVSACDPADLARLCVEESDDLASWPVVGDMRVYPLRSPEGGALLGALAVCQNGEFPVLSDRERQLIRQLVAQAEIAIEDRRLQQHLLLLLRRLTPQVENIQRWRSAVPYAGSIMSPNGVHVVEESPIFAPNFPQMVKDALSHYWGGPRLTRSPLLHLEVVRRRLAEHDNNPAKALRAVLIEALEIIKPDGERQLLAQDWLFYNILELKYIKGYRAKDVARRLAISESDLYRKQRAAIEELARAIAAMERAITEQEEVHHGHSGGSS